MDLAEIWPPLLPGKDGPSPNFGFEHYPVLEKWKIKKERRKTKTMFGQPKNRLQLLSAKRTITFQFASIELHCLTTEMV